MKSLLATLCLCLVLIPVSAQCGQKSGVERVVVKRETTITFLKRATLAASRVGIISSVPVQEGDQVRKTDLVARIDDRLPGVRRRIAKKIAENVFDLQYAEAARDLSSLDFEKAKGANVTNPGTYTDLELKQLELAANRSALAVEQANNNLQLAQLRAEEADYELDEYHIIAPFDGMISSVKKAPGEAVVLGEPVAELVSLDAFRADLYVSPELASKIRRGTPVELRINFPDQELDVENEVYQGSIVFIDRDIKVSDEVHIWAEIKNHNGKLWSGLRGSVTLLISE